MKIFINEIQLDILYNLLTEEKYDSVAKSVKPGDELKIVDKNNNEILFSVILNDAGRLYLKSAIKNNIYSNDFFFKDLSDIDNNSMELKRVNTPSEFRNIDDDSERLKKVLKKYPIDTWKKFTFKTIKQLYLNDIDIDINDRQAQQQAQQPQGVKDVKNYTAVTDPGELGDLISDFNAFKEGSDYNFHLIDGGEIKTNLFDNKGGSLNFKVLSLDGSASRYIDLENADIRLDVNANNIKKFEYYDKDTDETSTYYNITFKSVLGGSGPGSQKKVTVKYISDINVKTKPPKKEKNKPNIDDMSVEDITNLVINDATLQQAFYKKPGFLQSLIGGKPKGILAAKKILRKYFDSTYSDTSTTKGIKQLSDKFKTGQLYEIKLQDNSFNYSGVNIDMLETYILKAFKQTTTSGQPRPFLKGEGYVVKINSKIGDTNDYRVTIIVDSDNYEENRTMRITNLY